MAFYQTGVARSGNGVSWDNCPNLPEAALIAPGYIQKLVSRPRRVRLDRRDGWKQLIELRAAHRAGLVFQLPIEIRIRSAHKAAEELVSEKIAESIEMDLPWATI